MENENILFLDLETNSLDISIAEIIEVGFIVSTKNLSIIKSGSFLIKCENEIPKKIEDLLELNQDFLNIHGYDKQKGLEVLSKLIVSTKYVVAHNGLKFDYLIIERILGSTIFNDKIKIDTIKHLPNSFYETCELKKLKYMCLEKAILFPHIHRAIHDVNMVFALVKSFKSEIDDIIINANKVVKNFIIEISYADREKAKEIGGYWNSELKRWEIDLTADKYTLYKEQGFKLILNSIN